MSRSLKRLAVTGAALLVALCTGAWFSMSVSFRPARLARVQHSAHFRDGQFVNILETGVMQPGTTWSVAKAWLQKGDSAAPAKPVPVVTRDAASLGVPPADGVRVTWMGHSTMLLDVDGTRVLCDPMWSERASPVSFAGPKRFHPPPIPLDQLPTPDLVLISHDHYDHLDRATVAALGARGVRFITPLGVGEYLEEWGIPPAQVTELEWWESVEAIPGKLTVVSAPTRHFSGRGLVRNRTQWASYVLKGARHRVYFGGDSGLYPGLAEVAQRHGPLDVALLEIGAFHPAWGNIHLGPDGAADALPLLSPTVLVPMHWATFDLGLHAWAEPVEQLLARTTAGKLPVAFPRIGQTFTLGEPLPQEPWWR